MMDRHGAKAVFFGRWILGLRVWASWLAGASRMPWPRFVAWNAAGGISWATTVGLIIYFVGRAASQALQTAGFVGLAVRARRDRGLPGRAPPVGPRRPRARCGRRLRPARRRQLAGLPEL